jgi:hypothetical protein
MKLFWFQAEYEGLIHSHGPLGEFQYTIKWMPMTNSWTAFDLDDGVCMGYLQQCMETCERLAADK